METMALLGQIYQMDRMRWLCPGPFSTCMARLQPIALVCCVLDLLEGSAAVEEERTSKRRSEQERRKRQRLSTEGKWHGHEQEASPTNEIHEKRDPGEGEQDGRRFSRRATTQGGPVAPSWVETPTAATLSRDKRPKLPERRTPRRLR